MHEHDGGTACRNHITLVKEAWFTTLYGAGVPAEQVERGRHAVGEGLQLCREAIRGRNYG